MSGIGFGGVRLGFIEGGPGGGAAPSGPAGADLGANYPNPLVVGLQGRPIAAAIPDVGDVLRWSGTTWEPYALTAADVGADPAGTAATEVAGATANRYGTPWFGISAPNAPNNTFFDLTGVFFDIAAGETIRATLTVSVTTATAATLRASVCALIWVATRNTAGDIVVDNINPDAGDFNLFEVKCVQDGADKVKIVMKRQGAQALIFHVGGEIFRNVIT